MSTPDPNEAMREVARDVLRELVPGMLRDVIADSLTTGAGNGHAHGVHPTNGHAPGATETASEDRDEAPVDAVPRVPAPPVAAVLRPSTWDRPAAPGEIIGAPTSAPAGDPPPQRGDPKNGTHAIGAAATPADGTGVETVTIDTDEDLERFTRELMSRLENPRERLAIRKGQLRFALRRSGAANAGPGPQTGGAVTRIEKGAVTERVVREAAQAGTRLVLASGTVLTPLARDQAKALGVQIERERRC